MNTSEGFDGGFTAIRTERYFFYDFLIYVHFYTTPGKCE